MRVAGVRDDREAIISLLPGEVVGEVWPRLPACGDIERAVCRLRAWHDDRIARGLPMDHFI
eukprot:3847735-Lingulodinium_polyedra.AAC.1